MAEQNLVTYIERARNQDNEAMEQLVKVTQKKLYFVARSFVKSDADANDVLQDSYIKAFSALESLKDDSKFEAWITRIVSNTALDYMNKASAKYDIKFTDLANGEDELPFDTADERIESQPELYLSENETKRIIKEIVDSLSDEQRIAVMMHFFDGMTTKEIAQQIGCKEVTVKARIRYAKERIKESVETIQKRDGIKLYNLAPLPFFIWLIRGYAGNAYMTTAVASTVGATTAVASGTIATSSVGESAAAGAVTKVAASTGVKAFIGSTVGKIAVVGALAVTGGVAITAFNNTEKVVSYATNETTKTYYDGTKETIFYENYYFYDENGEPIKRATIVDGQITVTDTETEKDEDGNDYFYVYGSHKGESIKEKRIVTIDIDDDHSMKYVYCEVLPEYYDDFKCGLPANNEIITYDYGQLMMVVHYYKYYATGITVYNPDGSVNIEKNSNVNEDTNWSITDDNQYNYYFGLIPPGKGFNVTASRNDNTEIVTITDVCMSSTWSSNEVHCLEYYSGNTVREYKNDRIINSTTIYTFEYVGEVTEINGKQIKVKDINHEGYSNYFDDGATTVSENIYYEYASVNQANAAFNKILEEYGNIDADSIEEESIDSDSEDVGGQLQNEASTSNASTELSNEDLLGILTSNGFTVIPNQYGFNSLVIKNSDGTESIELCGQDDRISAEPGWVYHGDGGFIEWDGIHEVAFYDPMCAYDTTTWEISGTHVVVGLGGTGPFACTEETINDAKNLLNKRNDLLARLGITKDQLYNLALTYDYGD